jgi:hypothetical protein
MAQGGVLKFTEEESKFIHDHWVQVHSLQPELTDYWITDLLNASFRIMTHQEAPNDVMSFFIRSHGLLSEFEEYLNKIELKPEMIPLYEKDGVKVKKDYIENLETVRKAFESYRSHFTEWDKEVLKYVRDRESHFFTDGYIVKIDKKKKIVTDRGEVDRIEFREKVVDELRKYEGGEIGWSRKFAEKTIIDLEKIKIAWHPLIVGRNFGMYIEHPKLLFEE